MKKIKLDTNVKKDVVKSTVEYFYKYTPKDKDGKPKGKSIQMVHINGNFYGNGFNMSRNKIKAIMDNLELMKQFSQGKFDAVIDKLEEGEALEP